MRADVPLASNPECCLALAGRFPCRSRARRRRSTTSGRPQGEQAGDGPRRAKRPIAQVNGLHRQPLPVRLRRIRPVTPGVPTADYADLDCREISRSQHPAEGEPRAARPFLYATYRSSIRAAGFYYDATRQAGAHLRSPTTTCPRCGRSSCRASCMSTTRPAVAEFSRRQKAHHLGLGLCLQPHGPHQSAQGSHRPELPARGPVAGARRAARSRSSRSARCSPPGALPESGIPYAHPEVPGCQTQCPRLPRRPLVAARQRPPLSGRGASVHAAVQFRHQPHLLFLEPVQRLV